VSSAELGSLTPRMIDPGSAGRVYAVPYAPPDWDFDLGFGIYNPNDIPVDVQIVYHNNDGSTLSSQDFAAVPPLGHASFMSQVSRTHNCWAQVTASLPVEGMALAFGKGEDPMFDMDFTAASTHLLAAHVDTGGGWVSKAMLANPNLGPAHLTFTFRPSDGSAPRTNATIIPALGTTQYNLVHVAPGMTGAVEIDSDLPVAGFILYDGRNRGNYVGGLSLKPR